MRLCEAKESVFRRPSTSQTWSNVVSAPKGLRPPIDRLISTTCQHRQARCARTAPAPAARLVPRRITPLFQDGGMHDRAKKGFEADPDPVARMPCAGWQSQDPGEDLSGTTGVAARGARLRCYFDVACQVNKGESRCWHWKTIATILMTTRAIQPASRGLFNCCRPFETSARALPRTNTRLHNADLPASAASAATPVNLLIRLPMSSATLPATIGNQDRLRPSLSLPADGV